MNISLSSDSDYTYISAKAAELGITISRLQSFKLPCHGTKYIQTFFVQSPEEGEKMRSIIDESDWAKKWRVENLASRTSEPFFWMKIPMDFLMRIIIHSSKFPSSVEEYGAGFRSAQNTQKLGKWVKRDKLFIQHFVKYLSRDGVEEMRTLMGRCSNEGIILKWIDEAVQSPFH